MAQTYKVTKVGSVGDNAPSEWQGTFGPMITYSLMVDNFTGIVKMNQKKETNPPYVGQELYGAIDMSAKGGPKLTKEQRPTVGNPDTGSFTPKDGDAIKAQFAIKAAIQYSMTQNGAPAVEDITQWAILFYQMVDTVKSNTLNKLSNDDPSAF